MNLHFKRNEFVDYGLHDQDGGKNYKPLEKNAKKNSFCDSCSFMRFNAYSISASGAVSFKVCGSMLSLQGFLQRSG